MKVVIVGSGLAGVTVAETLAKSGRHDVTIVTSETHGYYSRPRLSHGLALSDEAAAKIVLKPFRGLEGMKVLSGREAWVIDRANRRLVLKDGKVLHYDALVLATGSAARIPPPLVPFRPGFVTLNSYDDLLTLRHRRAKKTRPRWAVIGGGLIGCEVASDLDKAGDAVTIFHREDRLMELVLDEAQSRLLHQHFQALGVEVRYRQDLRALPEGFDGVIVSTGFAPRIELAREAGLATARGIVVDPFLRTADPAIHAVGDVAEAGGRTYAFVAPIRSQALWLGRYLNGETSEPWQPPAFKPVIKVHGFKLPATVTA